MKRIYDKKVKINGYTIGIHGRYATATADIRIHTGTGSYIITIEQWWQRYGRVTTPEPVRGPSPPRPKVTPKPRPKAAAPKPRPARPIPAHTFESRQRPLFNLTVAPRLREVDVDNGNGFTWDKREPIRAPEVDADVKVPLLQALVTGILNGVPVFVALVTVDSLATKLNLSPWWEVITNWHHLGISTAVGWFITSRKWHTLQTLNRALLWAFEETVGHDVDGDGHVGIPVKIKPRAVPIHTTRGTSYADMTPRAVDDGAMPDEWASLATAVLVHNASPSRDGIMRAIDASPHNLTKLSQPLCNAMLQQLVDAHYKEPYGGLTEAGEIFLTQYVPHHIPLDVDYGD